VDHLVLLHEAVALAAVERRVERVPAVRRIDVAQLLVVGLPRRDQLAVEIGVAHRRDEPVALLALEHRARAEVVVVAPVLHHQVDVRGDAPAVVAAAAGRKQPRHACRRAQPTDRLECVASSHGAQHTEIVG
jgi:hypothetical protein